MKLAIALAIIGTSLAGGLAYADDHLFQATQSGGLILDEEQDIVLNKAGHVIPDTAPGQGSPFVGEHQCTPATATESAQEHANIKARGADSVDECAEAD
jgi:hypothetical protein